MAWNEPGGSGRDPWGGGGGNRQGPPELDEVLKKMQQGFRGVFGGGGDGGEGGTGGFKSTSILLLIGIILVVWLLSGIYIVQPGERGVKLRFGEYVTTSPPGPHWRIPWPIETVEIVDVDQIRTIEVGYRSIEGDLRPVPREALMLTQDENIVDVRLAVQYRVKSAEDYLFNVREPDETLRQATESALRGLVGRSMMNFVLTEGRAEIAQGSQEMIQMIADRYGTGLEVTTVNLQDAQPPEEVQHAFADVVKAREDEQRVINEARAYANEIVPTARGRAARVVEEAEAYRTRVMNEAEGEAERFTQVLDAYLTAPDVTQERLYLETMEYIFQNTSKVLLDIEEGNNLLYLPLDRMGAQPVQNMDERPGAAAVPQDRPLLPRAEPERPDERARGGRR